jgi:molybdate transport system substrate-binding protein
VRTRQRTHATTAASLLVALTLAGCGGDPGAAERAETGTLTVLAAASLTEVFTALAGDFESDHPGVRVRLAFDSSATLAEQVTQGAPADVLATADRRTMQTVVAADAVDGRPQVFATNQLQLVVPPDNPARISRFADIGRPGVKLVVCVRSAPCGELATAVLAATGVTVEPASEEVDVKAVLSKVQLDEADAGLVYTTDAAAAGNNVEVVPAPSSTANRTRYPIATLAEARKPVLARAWVELVTSAQGRRLLLDAGFGSP